MQRHNVNGLAYFTFDSLNGSDQIVHAVSTRHGGVSPAPFDTLNLSSFVGDDPANVSTNIHRLYASLALDPTCSVDASQVQADRLMVVNARHCGTRIEGVDGLLTNTPGVSLLLRYADCVPILLFDPIHGAIAIVHAGWRGTVMNIAAKAAQAMIDHFGAHPRDLIACIGPSIGPCCYQIGGDVIERVRNAFNDADALLIQEDDDHAHFDLWQANAIQLRALGVERIEIAGLCTAQHTDDFFSWRAEQNRTGRFGAIIAIRQ
jgi:polyphenol oxidase